MKKIRLFFRISARYRFKHKKRFFTFAIIIILGTAAIFMSSLLIRSQKQAMLEEELRLLGDYDMIFYDISDKDCNIIKSDSSVNALGKYYEIGYAKTDNENTIHAACFSDKDSERLYHMTCTKGHYPENENEIALDVNTAKELGIKPYPNQKKVMSVYSYSDELIIQKEYTVSGIYELSSPSAYGGWYRYPSMMDIDTVKMPGVFFYFDLKDKCDCKTVTAFLQTDESDLNALCNKLISQMTDVKWEQSDISGGRSFAYTYILGITDTIEKKYGDSSLSTIIKAMKNGDGIKDFYSGIFMPVFSLIIGLIVILSVIGISDNILHDRQEGFAVLRALGLEKSRLFLYTIVDLISFAVVFIFIGLILGGLIHICMIKLLMHFFDIYLEYGFNCSQVVNAVTLNPFLLSVMVVLICIIISSIFSAIKQIRLSPIKLFEGANIHTKHFARHGSIKHKNWKRMLSSRIELFNPNCAIICVVVMSVSLLGYTYFHALSDLDNAEYEFEKQEYELGVWDYKAERTDQTQMYEFGIENHHDQGMDISCYDKILNCNEVEDSVARIVNKSTRISYKNDKADSAIFSALEEFNMRRYSEIDESDTFEKSLQNAENAMIRKAGYDDNEDVFCLPSIGLSEKQIQELNKYVVDGQINIDKINAGEEVLIALSEYEYHKYLSVFKVGNVLPLSDIILSKEEDMIDFGRILSSDILDPVYKENVTTPEGDTVELTSYSFGKRHDINTTIGAVVVLDDENVMKYMTMSGEENYGANIICTFSWFDNNGLPDNKLTSLSVKLKKGLSADNFDGFWYELLSNSKGIKIRSTGEIIAKMNTGTRRIMSIYYSMIAILIILALIMVMISLYTDIRIRSNKFAILRACGMSVKQISFLVIKQNIVYPILGVLFSLVPLAICQRYFYYIRKMVDGGEWESTQFDGIPWYHYVPFRYELYSYNVTSVMLISFVICLTIILLVSIPQLKYISKQSIVDEIEINDF